MRRAHSVNVYAINLPDARQAAQPTRVRALRLHHMAETIPNPPPNHPHSI